MSRYFSWQLLLQELEAERTQQTVEEVRLQGELEKADDWQDDRMMRESDG